MNFKSIKARLPYFRFLKQHKVLLSLVLLAGLGASLMEGIGISMIFPIVQGADSLATTSLPFPFNVITAFFADMTIGERLRTVALILVIIMAIKGCMLYLKNICSIRLRIIISRHFQMEAFKQLMRAGMGYFNKQKGGELLTIINVHADNMGTSLARFGTIVHLPFTIIILITMLVYLSWQVTIVSLFLAALLFFAMRRLVRKTDLAGRKLSAALKRVGGTLLDDITGMKVIRLFNRERGEINRFEKVVVNKNEVVFGIGRLTSLAAPITEFIGALIVASVIVSASLFMFRPNSSYGIGFLLVFLTAFYRIIGPINVINSTRVAFTGDLPYYREVFSFLDFSDKLYMDNGTELVTELKQKIELRNVSFNYEAGDKTVLRAVSFTVDKGSKVGVVGSSGAGKSTLTELLLRFYDPQQGQLLIDGVDLKQLNLDNWRKLVGVVSQDVFLFNDTLKNNIAFANPGASQSEIENAARKAHAHDFIQALPRGYATLIGDRGVLLSGGQRQRIAIARAILANPQVLIFDEATSALDTESEKIVQEALDEVGQGRTVITIAHRLSTVADSSKIIVMEAGKVVEEGTHQELLNLNGVYSKLVKMQKLEEQIHQT